MALQRLSQVIALEASIKDRVHRAVTELHQASQKAELFNGFTRTYNPLKDGGETFPQETKRVQLQVETVMQDLEREMTALTDISATRDWANCVSVADVVMPNGSVLVAKAPVTFLLFLEKKLIDVRTFVSKLPTLDPNEAWAWDANTKTHFTAPVESLKTKKEPRVIVKYEATDKHAAQTELIHEDQTVGKWIAVKRSGAVPISEKNSILDNIETVIRAVKFAREEANSAPAGNKEVGRAIFSAIFASAPNGA